jgi:hypothetical protein
MLTAVKGAAGDRKLRLFACACCRGVWHLLADGRSRLAVEVAERFADGAGSRKTLDSAKVAALEAANAASAGRPGVTDGDRLDAYYAACASLRCAERQAIAAAGRAASWAAGPEVPGRPSVAPGHCDLLRDIFGPLPFRPVAADPAWLAWKDGTIPRLARTVYEERELPSGYLDAVRLAGLADALEEAGCTDKDLLAHLRGAGPHTRGCWVVDRLIGKE